MKKRENEIQDKNADVLFSLPDLVIEYHLNNIETTQLEAFKTKLNDPILNNKDTEKYGQLQWVSLGHPSLMAIEKEDELSWFDSTNDGFYTYVEMLTEHQKSLFVNEVKRKYNIDIQKAQITTLIVSDFKCKLKIECDEQKLNLIGQVNDMKTFPLRLFFEFGKAENEECIQNYILDNENNLELKCEVTTGASSAKTNSFSINFNSENNNELVNELFGDGDSAYVTRNQMDQFSQEIYSSMDVFEQYEIPDDQFNTVFVEDLIKQTADHGFESVPFDEAINGISRFNIDADLQPDEITSEYSKVFDVEEDDEKERLISFRV